MTARNTALYDSGQAVQAAIRGIMATHSPFASPLTAKTINARLPADLRRSESDIRHHMRIIRSAFDCCRVNVSGDLTDA